MKSLDSSHDRAADQPAYTETAHEDIAPLVPRRSPIARRADAGAAIDPTAARRSFAEAVNTGIHTIARDATGSQLASNAASLVAAASSSAGNPLPTQLRRKFEASLGADLSGVRVHTGEVSAQASRSIAARAYTTGNDIHFASGQYDPTSSGGEHLIAHEVAHTVQQSRGTGGGAQTKLEVTEPGDACEAEADRAADAMVAARQFDVGGASGVNRAIMRVPGDGDAPAQTGETQSPTSADGTGGTGTGTGTGGGSQPQTVATTWTIDYDRVYQGSRASGHRAADRTADSVLHVNSFLVQPQNPPPQPIPPFHGYHLQDAGRVTMGTVQHPANQGGQASASISYLTDGRVAIRAHGGTAPQRRDAQQRAVSALARQSELVPDDSQSSQAGLSPQDIANGITITASSRERRQERVTPIAADYSAITSASTVNVTVEVPTSGLQVYGESTHDHTDEGTAQVQSTDSQTQTDDTSTQSTVEAELRTTIEHSFETTVQDLSRQVCEWMLGGSGELNASGELGGNATATLGNDITANIPISAILLLVPGAEELAPLFGDDATIGTRLNQALQLALHATGRLGGRVEAHGEVRHVDEHALTTTIHDQIRSQMDTRFRSEVLTTVHRQTGTQHGTRVTGTGRSADTRHQAGHTEGEGTAQRDTPRLVIRNVPQQAEPPPRRSGAGT